MNDSNRTLRFSRTAREAGIYGPIGQDHDPDGMVVACVAIGLAFLFGFLLGAA